MVIYTDGACSQNGTWNGGWGILIVSNGKMIKGIGDYDANTTNNIMELMAFLQALNYYDKNKKNDLEALSIYTDSAYIYNCITKKWYVKWRQNGWIKGDGHPVLNQDLWENILTFYEKYDIIKIEKVKAHDKNIYNNEVDNIAVTCKISQQPYYKEY